MNNFFLPIRKFFFLGLLLLVFFTFFYFHLYSYLNFSILKTYQAEAQVWTINHYPSAVVLYILIYTLLIACAIPCATLLTLMGGFLFGTIAIAYAVFSTTAGGVFLFLAIRTALGPRLMNRSPGWLKRMEKGIQEDAFNYLLMLRLVPVLPCWISNIGAGMLNVPLKTFISATILGILPATFIYVMAGRGLDKLITADPASFLYIILTPSILFPLLGLAFLSIFPVIYKHIK